MPESRTPAGAFRTLANQLPPLPVDETLPLEERKLRGSSMSVGTPSKPVLGLPLARWIPQDCHSFMDYSNGLVTASCTALTDDRSARFASVALASLVLGVSAVTDCRLSVARVLPIEAHEVADYVWGATAIAAPFVLGYWKRAPKVALAHIVAGVGAILGSLVTDYRAYSRRSQTAAG